MEKNRYLQTAGNIRDVSLVSGFINSIVDITTGDVKDNHMRNLINDP